MKVFISILFFILFGCASQNSGKLNVNDADILEKLVGEWGYTTGTEECKEYGFIGFRRNGKYTRSSENCHLADDSFGYYYYGWYITDGFICFVETKEHLDQIKYLGFIRDHCRWKIIEYSEKQFLVHNYWWSVHEEEHEYKIIRLFKP